MMAGQQPQQQNQQNFEKEDNDKEEEREDKEKEDKKEDNGNKEEDKEKGEDEEERGKCQTCGDVGPTGTFCCNCSDDNPSIFHLQKI